MEHFSLYPPCILWWQVREYHIKPVCTFLPAFSVGELTGENVILYIVVACRNTKLSGFPVPVARRRPNFTPVTASSQLLKERSENFKKCLRFIVYV
jgi:hypothetical protein